MTLNGLMTTDSLINFCDNLPNPCYQRAIKKNYYEVQLEGNFEDSCDHLDCPCHQLGCLCLRLTQNRTSTTSPVVGVYFFLEHYLCILNNYPYLRML